jgi:flagellar protein FliL
MAGATEEEEGEPKKKSGLVMTIVIILVLTLLAGGGGWVVGGMLAPGMTPAAPVKTTGTGAVEQPAAKDAGAEAEASGGEHGDSGGAHGAEAEGEGIPKISTEANGVVQLEAITSNLYYPAENLVRLEVALLFKGPPDVAMAEDIHQDIMAYLRTVSLQEIEGPRGFQYLKDDIQERVDLRSQGRVSKVMFRTFVIE